MRTPAHEIKPEDCPEPYWHETHRYCPACSWTEAPQPPTPEQVARAVEVLRKDGIDTAEKFEALLAASENRQADDPR